MSGIIIGGVITLLAFFACYQIFFAKTDGKQEIRSNQTVYVCFFVILLIGLVFRLILGAVYRGYESDMNCFIGWANMLVEGGISNFYVQPGFTDYPPGYMYVLSILGFIRNALHIPMDSGICFMLIKLPAILCDMAAGVLIFWFAGKYMNKKHALVLASIYIFNPIVWMDSAVWGQVDSVFTLAVILAFLLLKEKKWLSAYIVFGIGILIKPQTLVFTPVILYSLTDEVVRAKTERVKVFLMHLWKGLAAILAMLVLMLPFGIEHAIKQTFETLSSYANASVNAYNIWALFGLNWADQNGTVIGVTYNQIGTIFICLLVLLSAYLYFKNRENDSKYFISGASLIIGMFMLSVRMHERYIYPGILLLLFTFIIKPTKHIYAAYALFSVTLYANMADILFLYDVNNFNAKAPLTIFISLLNTVIYLYFLYTLKKYFINGNGWEKEKKKPQHQAVKKTTVQLPMHFAKSEPFMKMRRKDWLILLSIMAVYSAFALYDLGDRQAPETQWKSERTGEEFVLDLGETKTISEISYFLGNYENRKFDFAIGAQPDGPFTFLEKPVLEGNDEEVSNPGEIVMQSVFAWGRQELSGTGRYLRVRSNSDKAALKEMVLLDSAKQAIMPVNIVGTSVKALFDEQKMHPERSTFRDSTYFDEIYHARTAYEYIAGDYSYENTHPPLGKIFISLGMLLFGVNPFGWRIMGTLFGIAMIPFIYLFAKQMTKKTWLAACISILFSFDFMHFAQTRIATIDVFVTFFIIVMYYFMYRYYTSSFYDIGLGKTLLPLGACGIAMGFAWACKWTGIYASAGLALLFFITLYKRYREYLYAKKDPKGKTDGILHAYVMSQFSGYAWKTILFCVLFFIIIPICIYTLSYIPFENGQGGGLITRMLQNQETMFSYHVGVDSTHPYSSWWYQWPIIYRPIWYFSGNVSDTLAEGISAFGNPLVWWVGIPAFLYQCYRIVKKKDSTACFLVVGYLSQYLPWVFVSRITFIYHYFPSVPFVVLMIGHSIRVLTEEKPKLRRIAFAYTAAAVLLFVMFYPVLAGQPVNRDYVSMFLRWFPSWVLVS